MPNFAYWSNANSISQQIFLRFDVVYRENLKFGHGLDDISILVKNNYEV